MESPETTKMSSKGQVVIPESIRKRLGLESGVQFVVVASGDAIVLKPVAPPSMDEFDDVLADARRQARRAGLKRSDIREMLTQARRGQ